MRVHDHLFCSALLSKTWYKMFVREFRGGVKEEDVIEGRELGSLRNTVFKAEVRHMSVAKYVLHVWSRSVQAGKVLNYVDHMSVWNIARVHPGCTSLVIKVVLSIVNQVRYEIHFIQIGRRQILCDMRRSVWP